jgi:hypothetical protein
MLVMAGTAIAQDFYRINKDVKVLAFVGKPSSLNTKAVQYTTAVKQYITLFHKRSGPNLYAFHLKGLIVKGKDGEPRTVKNDGFIVVKKRLLKKYK